MRRSTLRQFASWVALICLQLGAEVAALRLSRQGSHISRQGSHSNNRGGSEAVEVGTAKDAETTDGILKCLSKDSEVLQEGTEYLVDNSVLQAKTRGMGYRFTKDLKNVDKTSFALWGSTVWGKTDGDWVKVGACFLPMTLKSTRVLTPVKAAAQDGSSKEHMLPRTASPKEVPTEPVQSAEIILSANPSPADQSAPAMDIPTQAPLQKEVIVSTSSLGMSQRQENAPAPRTLPSAAPAVSAEAPQVKAAPERKCSGASPSGTGKLYLLDNSKLHATTKGMGLRFTKDPKNIDKASKAVWGSTVTGIDLGDGWLQVGDCYLPTTLKGIMVLTPVSADADASASQATLELSPKEVEKEQPATAAEKVALGIPAKEVEKEQPATAAEKAALGILAKEAEKEQPTTVAEKAALGLSAKEIEKEQPATAAEKQQVAASPSQVGAAARAIVPASSREESLEHAQPGSSPNTSLDTAAGGDLQHVLPNAYQNATSLSPASSSGGTSQSARSESSPNASLESVASVPGEPVHSALPTAVLNATPEVARSLGSSTESSHDPPAKDLQNASFAAPQSATAVPPQLVVEAPRSGPPAERPQMRAAAEAPPPRAEERQIAHAGASQSDQVAQASDSMPAEHTTAVYGEATAVGRPMPSPNDAVHSHQEVSQSQDSLPAVTSAPVLPGNLSSAEMEVPITAPQMSPAMDTICSLDIDVDGGSPYLLDNSQLQATTRGMGLRLSKNLKDLDRTTRALWGSTVIGTDLGDGWLRVGNCYLPTELQGVPVIKAALGGEDKPEAAKQGVEGGSTFSTEVSEKPSEQRSGHTTWDVASLHTPPLQQGPEEVAEHGVESLHAGTKEALESSARKSTIIQSVAPLSTLPPQREAQQSSMVTVESGAQVPAFPTQEASLWQEEMTGPESEARTDPLEDVDMLPARRAPPILEADPPPQSESEETHQAAIATTDMDLQRGSGQSDNVDQQVKVLKQAMITSQQSTAKRLEDVQNRLMKVMENATIMEKDAAKRITDLDLELAKAKGDAAVKEQAATKRIVELEQELRQGTEAANAQQQALAQRINELHDNLLKTNKRKDDAEQTTAQHIFDLENELAQTKKRASDMEQTTSRRIADLVEALANEKAKLATTEQNLKSRIASLEDELTKSKKALAATEQSMNIQVSDLESELEQANEAKAAEGQAKTIAVKRGEELQAELGQLKEQEREEARQLEKTRTETEETLHRWRTDADVATEAANHRIAELKEQLVQQQHALENLTAHTAENLRLREAKISNLTKQVEDVKAASSQEITRLEQRAALANATAVQREFDLKKELSKEQEQARSATEAADNRVANVEAHAAELKYELEVKVRNLEKEVRTEREAASVAEADAAASEAKGASLERRMQGLKIRAADIGSSAAKHMDKLDEELTKQMESITPAGAVGGGSEEASSAATAMSELRSEGSPAIAVEEADDGTPRELRRLRARAASGHELARQLEDLGRRALETSQTVSRKTAELAQELPPRHPGRTPKDSHARELAAQLGNLSAEVEATEEALLKRTAEMVENLELQKAALQSAGSASNWQSQASPGAAAPCTEAAGQPEGTLGPVGVADLANASEGILDNLERLPGQLEGLTRRARQSGMLVAAKAEQLRDQLEAEKRTKEKVAAEAKAAAAKFADARAQLEAELFTARRNASESLERREESELRAAQVAAQLESLRAEATHDAQRLREEAARSSDAERRTSELNEQLGKLRLEKLQADSESLQKLQASEAHASDLSRQLSALRAEAAAAGEKAAARIAELEGKLADTLS